MIEKSWGGCGQKWLQPQSEWMNELGWSFACSCMVWGKLKVTFGIHMVKYGYVLLGPGTLESAVSQE